MSVHATNYLIGGLIAAVVIGLRLWRSGVGRGGAGGARRLRLEWLWVAPAVLTLGAGVLLAYLPPHGVLAWLALAGVTLAGGALGWWRGTLIPVEVDRETHALNTRTSRAAILFLGAVFVLRYAVRAVLNGESQTLHIATALITDGFVLFAAGLYGVSRLEIFLRARRLLREARALGAHGVLVDPGTATGASSAPGASPTAQ